MPHPLEVKLNAVRRRARRLLQVHAASRVASWLLAALLLAGLADYLVHFQDRGLRVIASLSVLAAAAWAVGRFLVPAWRARFRDVPLAQRIEQRFPHLTDRLSSTIEFLHEPEDDPLAGSPALRKAVIGQTTAEIETLDLSDVVDPRPARRAAWSAAGLAVMALALAAFDGESVRTALLRLADPFGETAWPRHNYLKIVHPVERLASGQAFEVEVVDVHDARLPDEVYIQYRYRGDGPDAAETAEPMRLIGKTMLARKESVTRPFAYRAVGGDDHTMRWIELEVVEPPAVEQISVRLHHPPYTGWPPAAAEPHIRALVGTRVEISARTTKRLKSAGLHVEGGPAIAMQLSDDGYGFSLPVPGGEEFVVQKSGSYWFELTDLQGFPGGRQMRYDLRAIEDLPPTVNIEDPAGNIFVTAEAVVPLRVSAKDDLALSEVAFHFARSDRSEQDHVSVVLHQGPPKVQPSQSHVNAANAAGESRTLEHRWDLAASGLAPGVQITLHASATDYQPLVGQSNPRRISIITADELESRLSERQNFILNELARILKLQRDTRGQVAGLQIQLDKVGRLEEQHVDQLQGADLLQRQVARSLNSDTEGVTTQIAGLLGDLANNRIDSPDVVRRMQDLLDRLEALGQEQLPGIAQELTAAIKQAQQDSAPGESLAAAGRQQDEVIESLEQMLGDLSQWDDYRQFYRDVGQLRREQEELGRQTAELGRQTLTAAIQDLPRQQQAELKKLGTAQLELARRFDKIQQRIERMAAQMVSDDAADPLAADTLADALAQAREQALAGAMRQAGRHVEENQVGQAAARQQQVAEGLQEMLDILSNRREHELARLVKKLREAEQQLEHLRNEQQGLRKQWDKAAEIDDESERRRELERLAREQKRLEEEVERFARKLQRLQAEQAGRTAGRSSDRMQQASQQAGQDDAAGAARQAAQAEKDLDEAQQQLADARRQAEIDLAVEQLARLEDGLVSLKSRQQRLVEETRHYDGLRRDQGELTRPQAISVGDLALQQQALQRETEDLAQKLSAAAAFHLGLKLAARHMNDAAGMLGRRETGPPAQDAAGRALVRLEQMLAALATDPDQAAGGQQAGQAGGGQGGAGQGGQPQTDGIRLISELKLLTLMQQELNHRTRQLDEAYRQRETLSPAEQQEYAALSQEQGELADLLLDLTQPAESNPEDDPDSLPEPIDKPDVDPSGVDSPPGAAGETEETLP